LPMRALYRLLRQHTFGEAPGSNAHARWTPRASSSLTAAEESTPPPPQPAVLAVEDFTFVLVSQLTSVGTSTRRPQRQLPIWSSKVWLGSLDGTELEREPMQRGANDTADAFFGSCLEAEDERGTTRLTVYVAPPSAPSTPMSLLYTSDRFTMHALGDPLLGDCNLDEPLLVSEDKPLPYRYGDAEARGGDDEALTLRVVVSSSSPCRPGEWIEATQSSRVALQFSGGCLPSACIGQYLSGHVVKAREEKAPRQDPRTIRFADSLPSSCLRPTATNKITVAGGDVVQT